MGLDMTAAVAAETTAPALEPALQSRIETLIETRLAARRARDWSTSDRLRGELEDLGVALKDAKDSTTWEMRR